jgi:hypothetical protein
MNVVNIYRNNLSTLANVSTNNRIIVDDYNTIVIYKPSSSYFSYNYWYSSKTSKLSESENSNKDYKNIKCVINNSFYTYLNLINIYNMNDETEQILNDSGFESESVMNLLNDKESINNILCLLRKSILGVERYYLNNSNITLEEEYVCDISNYVNKLKDEIKSIDDIIENRSITFIKEKTDTSIDISNDINTTSDDSVSIFTNDEISLNDIDIGTNTESDTATNIKISISDSDDINSSDDDECETINEENSDNDSNGNVFTALYNIYYNIKSFFCRLVGFN